MCPVNPLDEISARGAGLDLDEHLARQALNESLSAAIEEIIFEPISQWPSLEFKWDLSIEGREFSFDPPTFLPSDDPFKARKEWLHSLTELKLGFVLLEHLDPLLSSFCYTDIATELWTTGNAHKLARVIAHVAAGQAMSPIVITPNRSGEISFVGGHHRYRACKATTQTVIPFYCYPDDSDLLSQLLEIDWS
ncbi:MAG: ParB N-terminal domain-containing protein [Thalassospira sp.]|uniref:ParB N-terminal domain-containing protein n=1 Tax=Thalassospira sp. TaxID=1912094 RepID=UPI003A8BAD3F